MSWSSNVVSPLVSFTRPSDTQFASTNFFSGVRSASATSGPQVAHSASPNRHRNGPCFQNFRTQKLYSPSAGMVALSLGSSGSPPAGPLPLALSQLSPERSLALPSSVLGPKGLFFGKLVAVGDSPSHQT